MIEEKNKILNIFHIIKFKKLNNNLKQIYRKEILYEMVELCFKPI